MKIQNNTKLETLVDKVVDYEKYKLNGNGARDIVRSLCKEYDGHPEELRPYFDSEHDGVVGVTTSAYTMLTGNMEPVTQYRTGGLGLILSSSSGLFSLSHKQGWGAKGSDDAFGYAMRSDGAFMDSKGIYASDKPYPVELLVRV